MNILDLNKDVNVILSDPYSVNSISKMNCTVDNNNIFLKSPKCKLLSNINSGYIVIELNNNKKSNLFKNFILNIEKLALNKIKEKWRKKYKVYSGFISNSNKYIFKTNLSKDIKFFDISKKCIRMDEIVIYSDIILLANIKDIWINVEKKMFGIT